MHYLQIFTWTISFLSYSYSVRYYSHVIKKKTESQKN